MNFNPIYLANQFGELRFFWQENIYFSLSNQQADLKQFCTSLFFKEY